MQSTTSMQIAKYGSIAISILFCFLGCSFIWFPNYATRLQTLCAISFLIFGCIKLIGYLSKDLYRLAFQYDLEIGILLFLIGWILLIHQKHFLNLICISFGIYVIIDGLFKLRICFDAKTFGIPSWWMTAGIALGCVLFGFLLAFKPVSSHLFLMSTLGITFLLEGVLNLVTMITMVKIIDHQYSDSITTTYEESEE